MILSLEEAKKRRDGVDRQGNLITGITIAVPLAMIVAVATGIAAWWLVLVAIALFAFGARVLHGVLKAYAEWDELIDEAILNERTTVRRTFHV